MPYVRHFWLVSAVILLPLIGYGIVDFSGRSGLLQRGGFTGSLAFSVVAILFGLSIPYLMLKLSMHRAHLNDPKEKTVELGDMAKDKQDLTQTGR